MKPLSVLAVLDGGPGHEKQTLAVVAALGELTPTDIRQHRFPDPGAGPLRRVRETLSAARKSSRPGSSGGPDIVIGTGSRTLLPLLAARAITRARALTCMLPDFWCLPFMDLCFVPRHDRPANRSNILLTSGPPALPVRRTGNDPAAGLILVGGTDERRLVWDGRDVADKVSEIIRRTPDMQWTVTTSPRTPAETEALLSRDLMAMQHAELIPFSQTPRGWVEAAYAENTVAWITGDSVSMVFEALGAGCRVGVVETRFLPGGAKFERGLLDLQAEGRVVFFNDWAAGRAVLPPPSPLNEARACAMAILERWWPERLP